MRTADELLADGLTVLNASEAYAVNAIIPLFSGGHDSLCATHIASYHRLFSGHVYHIDTGIGAKRTREFVERVCGEQDWVLRVFKSPETYEKFVRERGFPGPGRHAWVYNRIKERCIRQMVKGRGRVSLITGCRSAESTRRMGHVEPIKHGEKGRGLNTRCLLNRVWVAPCHDWTVEDQRIYMDHHGLPDNPLKRLVGMSGECFCGAFAAPGELDNKIRPHCPDVATEIDRLAEIALSLGKHAVWGTRPPGKRKGLEVIAPAGPLCTGCEHKAMLQGYVIGDAK